MAKEEALYIGHRQRLKERFLRAKGSDMADYEAIELLLTYAIPRRDVKPLAKNLIKEFGSFAGIITADYQPIQAMHLIFLHNTMQNLCNPSSKVSFRFVNYSNKLFLK